MKISAKTKSKPTPVTVEYDIPADLEGKRKAFGDEVINASAGGAIVISLQAFMRRLITKDKKPAEIQTEVSKWKPDARTVVKQTALEKASSALDKLSPEERKALMEKLRALGSVDGAKVAAVK